MKLDAWPFSSTVRVHPHAAMEQIRKAVRPAVMRSQKRWKRKARMRKLMLRAETVTLWTIGIAGVVLAVSFVVAEAYYLMSFLAGGR
jgi:hypothetical protein